jgi:hypothetical protein
MESRSRAFGRGVEARTHGIHTHMWSNQRGRIRSADGQRPIRRDEDEDENLGRVGSLERGTPIFLLTETLWHRHRGRFGALGVEVLERRPGVWSGRGRKGENPREVKSQERIGSNHLG